MIRMTSIKSQATGEGALKQNGILAQVDHESIGRPMPNVLNLVYGGPSRSKGCGAIITHQQSQSCWNLVNNLYSLEVVH